VGFGRRRQIAHKKKGHGWHGETLQKIGVTRGFAPEQGLFALAAAWHICWERVGVGIWGGGGCRVRSGRGSSISCRQGGNGRARDEGFMAGRGGEGGSGCRMMGRRMMGRKEWRKW